jgi:hypothetical protein
MYDSPCISLYEVRYEIIFNMSCLSRFDGVSSDDQHECQRQAERPASRPQAQVRRLAMMDVTACRIVAIGLLVLLSSPVSARVLHIEVASVAAEPPATPGAPAYEILRGTFDGTLDPTDARNAVITDISLASRNADGKIAYTATFAISRPVDPARASGVLFYNVPNRGNGGVAADPDGHVRVTSGWQGDIVPSAGLQTISVPVARMPDGRSVTGLALARFTDMEAGITSLPIVAGLVDPVARPLPVSLDTRRARLTRQASDSAPAVPIAPALWAFGDCRSRPFPGTPDPRRICLRGGFDPGFAYTLVYRAKDPLVLGIGFAATRDLVAFLRRGSPTDNGLVNPLGRMVRWAVASGTSQSGNFLKSFINLGFNEDEAGRIVFDGVNPDIAARQVPLNIRFGVPGGAAGLYEPGSEGTLWWSPYRDVSRGRSASSLLDRCTRSQTCPKVIETFGSAELWALRMSPGLVGTAAETDVPLPANVRRYYFPSVTHGGSPTGGFPLAGDPVWNGAPRCTMKWNPNPSSDTLRALQKALVDWVQLGTEPPASKYPTKAAGDLVLPTALAMGFPTIAGAPMPDGKINRMVDYDLGPQFHYADLSGVITRQPPRPRRLIASLVPRVNSDGNETSGLPSVNLLVPTGTYTGWNEQAAGYGKGGGCLFIGGFIPFARDRASRLRINDPRPSLEERYATHAGFVDRIRTVVRQRVGEGLLLSRDASRIVAQAEASEVLK